VQIAGVRIDGGALYAVTFGAWAAVGIIVGALRHFLPDTPVFLSFVPIVIAAALLGGVGPGLLASALSVGVALARLLDAATPCMFAIIGVGSAPCWREKRRARSQQGLL
jgi:hypothetical protein